MSDPYERMNASGIELPPCPPPGRFIRSGQGLRQPRVRLGADAHARWRPGVQGQGRNRTRRRGGYEAARLAALNCLAELEAVCGDLRRVEDILKVNGYVAASEGFEEQPTVINGASDLLREIFGDHGVHARTAIGVQSLPGRAPVEVELIASLSASRSSSTPSKVVR